MTEYLLYKNVCFDFFYNIQDNYYLYKFNYKTVGLVPQIQRG